MQTGQKGGQSAKKTHSYIHQNTFETLKDVGSSIPRAVGDSLSDLGTGMLDQLFGGYAESKPKGTTEQPKNMKPRQESSLFRFENHREEVLVSREIQELVQVIRMEIDAMSRQTATLSAKLKDTHNTILNTPKEQKGVYHVRFLELVLAMVRSVRAELSNSTSWLEAMTTKKAKRGSLFMAQSKKKGTQYSMSQELSVTRSTQ